jgi:glycerophosphoryl diester phosphodiesterase
MKHPFLRVPTPCVLGHRGAAGECPENTLTSFERALARGATILETDLRLTREGVAVVRHDARLERTTDGSGRVADHNLAELRRLDAGYRFSAPDRERPSTPYRGRGLRIPTLGEALATFPNARFNLELKDRDPRLVEAVLEGIADAGAADRVLLTAGADAVMARIRERVNEVEAGVALGACSGEIGSFVKSAIAGVAPPKKLAVLQVPARFGGVPLVTPRFVGHAHRHSLVVHVWTINDEAEMRALLDLGVDGLVTDFPARAVDQIARRG